MEAHKGQYRKNGVDPYVTHPIRVARQVTYSACGVSGVTVPQMWVSAALLHDVHEDTSMDLHAIGVHSSVVNIVNALTHVGRSSHAKMDAVEKICGHPGAIMVKMADRLDNTGYELDDEHSREYRLRHTVRQSTRLLLAYAADAEFRGVKWFKDSIVYARLTYMLEQADREAKG